MWNCHFDTPLKLKKYIDQEALKGSKDQRKSSVGQSPASSPACQSWQFQRESLLLTLNESWWGNEWIHWSKICADTAQICNRHKVFGGSPGSDTAWIVRAYYCRYLAKAARRAFVVVVVAAVALVEAKLSH